MNLNELLLMLLTTIELANLVIRLIKIIPQKDPKIEDYILRTMYA